MDADIALACVDEIPELFLREESLAYCDWDMKEIYTAYKKYHNGCSFIADVLATESGTLEFVPSALRYKLAASLIDKQARFLFAEAPDVLVEGTPEDAEQIDQIERYVQKVLADNNFESGLLKAARDCFIGKRIAILANFDHASGVTLTFVPSKKFVYEYSLDNPKQLSKFVYFQKVPVKQNEYRIYKKKYRLTQYNAVMLYEGLYFENGDLDEELLAEHETELSDIPAVVILNDGLTGDQNGESEILHLSELESHYSKLSNADIDAARFGMTPVTVVTDADDRSFIGLSRKPGALWAMQTNQNQETKTPINVRMLESTMNYSTPLTSTLERIKSTAYNSVDIPDVSLDTMTGVITSGKALKAVYWSLVVRCKEKMKVWAPALRKIIRIIIEGGQVFPDTIYGYSDSPLPDVPFSIKIVANNSLPDDDAEEQALDIANVESRTMSRKAYMQKWRGLDDKQVDDELKQIAYERELMENSYANPLPITNEN